MYYVAAALMKKYEYRSSLVYKRTPIIILSIAAALMKKYEYQSPLVYKRTPIISSV